MARKFVFNTYSNIKLPNKTRLALLQYLMESLLLGGSVTAGIAFFIVVLALAFSTILSTMRAVLLDTAGNVLVTFSLALVVTGLGLLLKHRKFGRFSDIFFEDVYQGVVTDKKMVRNEDGAYDFYLSVKGFTLDNRMTEADMAVSYSEWSKAKVNRMVRLRFPSEVLARIKRSDDS